MGVIPNGASGYTPQTTGFAINGSGGENLRLEQRSEANVRTNLEGTKGAENATGFNAFGGAIGGIIGGIFNTWFGGHDSVGHPSEVAYTIQDIKDTVLNGYTVEAKISSGTWTVPENIKECVVILIGGGASGGNGDAGSMSAMLGGAGGFNGSYLAVSLDVDSLGESVDYVVGQGGVPSSGTISAPSVPGTPTSFGNFAVTSPNAEGGIGTTFGYTPTNSTPGNGGAGGGITPPPGTGQYSATPAEVGQSSAAAGGGAKGTGGGTTGTAGGHGGTVSGAAQVKCGGGGGGGGVPLFHQG